MGSNKHERMNNIDIKYPQSTKNNRFCKLKKRTLKYEAEALSKNKIYFLNNLK
jgi:hypothetical protein